MPPQVQNPPELLKPAFNQAQLETALLVAKFGNVSLLREAADVVSVCIRPEAEVLLGRRMPEWIKAWASRAARGELPDSAYAELLRMMPDEDVNRLADAEWINERHRALAAAEKSKRSSGL